MPKLRLQVDAPFACAYRIALTTLLTVPTPDDVPSVLITMIFTYAGSQIPTVPTPFLAAAIVPAEWVP